MSQTDRGKTELSLKTSWTFIAECKWKIALEESIRKQLIEECWMEIQWVNHQNIKQKSTINMLKILWARVHVPFVQTDLLAIGSWGTASAWGQIPINEDTVLMLFASAKAFSFLMGSVIPVAWSELQSSQEQVLQKKLNRLAMFPASISDAVYPGEILVWMSTVQGHFAPKACIFQTRAPPVNL